MNLLINGGGRIGGIGGAGIIIIGGWAERIGGWACTGIDMVGGATACGGGCFTGFESEIKN